MKKIILICVFIFGMFLSSETSWAKIEDLKYNKLVSDFQDRIKNDKVDEMADHVIYPLQRRYPIPPVVDKEDFIKRYDEIFDAEQKEFLLRVNPNEDWISEKYGRTFWTISQEETLMLKRPLIASFVDLDMEGNLIQLMSSNKESEQVRILKQDATGLHESIKDFDALNVIVDTGKFVVRIDHMEKGKYRYASWTSGKSMDEKPDLILLNGECRDGLISGSCIFKSGAVRYEVSLYFDGGASGGIYAARLTVSKNGEVILVQEAAVKYPDDIKQR